MSANEEIVCPWCQTEIVWDPEIGPEDECPHCFNELNDYRSIDLKVKLTGQPLRFQEQEYPDSDEDLSLAWDDSDEPLDKYGEKVQHITDEQEEAPECSSCHELLLLAGSEVVSEATFTPTIPKTLGSAFLTAPFTMNVYVCPSCFKVEKILSDTDRLLMVERIKSE
ncbi:hypothetical protein [Paenibacillus aceris]|uniref:Uncharacterized protein n=1 Tax=Paenibacillus aceris TaxID=869555 RepID=A0ABS4HW35_9BACL|nr:hypothetical protein [Paenibacillus aceris]MBP1962436.1 hypothetical protein [Paenibacillus aceris]NHW37251.1 hypothetical protein [Paenibacillus aceris]